MYEDIVSDLEALETTHMDCVNPGIISTPWRVVGTYEDSFEYTRPPPSEEKMNGDVLSSRSHSEGLPSSQYNKQRSLLTIDIFSSPKKLISNLDSSNILITWLKSLHSSIKSLSISFPNCLPADSYKGAIDNITTKGGPNGVSNLAENAKLFKVEKTSLKGVTEHVAHASTKQLGKTGVHTLYAVIHVLISILSLVY
ncbi:predicted protein [Histoplasma capsulatum G186AR]|uniref:Uncharacterized protein n=1 Tax=Ajellomyces capsulatus (strain G186AR / H82 / ATCC MYA-2454 / RMSCC 2432) TaxID=447093 RepID=C0P0Z5_AJECG|nr:uncharacterized protein HCBG_09075 [Histoplasma capsulatum G186AR]EEH02631.1 predicted protein [Histoplasma capsulatum G186AR]